MADPTAQYLVENSDLEVLVANPRYMRAVLGRTKTQSGSQTTFRSSPQRVTPDVRFHLGSAVRADRRPTSAGAHSPRRSRRR